MNVSSTHLVTELQQLVHSIHASGQLLTACMLVAVANLVLLLLLLLLLSVQFDLSLRFFPFLLFHSKVQSMADRQLGSK